MKPQHFLLLTVIAILFWPANTVLPSLGDDFELMANEGMVAMLLNSKFEIDKPTPAPVTKCQCNGTKKVRSPDGITLIPCQCGASCPCQKTGDVGVACACQNGGSCICEKCTCASKSLMEFFSKEDCLYYLKYHAFDQNLRSVDFSNFSVDEIRAVALKDSAAKAEYDLNQKKTKTPTYRITLPKPYPVHSSRVPINGRANASLSTVYNHLKSHGNHAEFRNWNLNGYTQAELLTMHYDDHYNRLKLVKVPVEEVLISAASPPPIPSVVELPPSPVVTTPRGHINTNLNEQIIYLTANWCGPCTQFKNTEVPRLQKMGWIVSGDDKAHIRIVDIDVHPEVYAQYGGRQGIPMFIKLRFGKEVGRLVGYHTAEQVQGLWNK